MGCKENINSIIIKNIELKKNYLTVITIDILILL